MNLKSYDFFADNGMLIASFVYRFHRLYICKEYLYKLDSIKKELADNGLVLLDWEEVQNMKKRKMLKPWADTICVIIEMFIFTLALCFGAGVKFQETILGILFNFAMSILLLLITAVIESFRSEHSNI